MNEIERIIANNSLNLRIEIEQYVIKARIEELERLTWKGKPMFLVNEGIAIKNRIAELKKGLK